MNWDAVSAIAEILGVLAVVISLVYVGFQVRQNTMQLRQDNLLNNVRGTVSSTAPRSRPIPARAGRLPSCSAGLRPKLTNNYLLINRFLS